MEHIILTEDGHVLVITLNRPAKYNALSLTMHTEIGQALARLNRDPGLRVAVLCAEGVLQVAEDEYRVLEPAQQ